ncbi:flavodoxin family protein [Oleidesulfovibrio sp.]|uniref:flavodoxin family protein n=1 Tax=Oleidesulfovibrio sp. TaxID=2909707 RepID=UPI003A89BA50
MKVYAINGSPRKNMNTATLLESALAGARAAANGQVETELIHIYDYDHKGCISCMQCKRNLQDSYAKCALKDTLSPVLEKLSQADGIIFGSPIYFHGITGKLYSFFERLLFPNIAYDANYSSLAPKKMPTAFIYTMNVTEQQMIDMNLQSSLGPMQSFIERIFTKPQIMYAFNTYQVKDYSKYKIESFSEEEKAAYRATQFPLDCENAFSIGASMGK